jgi:hypothetical protein
VIWATGSTARELSLLDGAALLLHPAQQMMNSVVPARFLIMDVSRL